MQRNEEYVDVRRLNHRHTVSWDPGVADSHPLAVCYDCLCLISLCDIWMGSINRSDGR